MLNSPAQPSYLSPFLMWLCAALFYAFQLSLRVYPSIITEDLMSFLQIEAVSLGAITSFYYYGYSFMQIPAGIFLDYLGPRRPLTWACLLCCLGCLLFATSNTVVMLSLGRFLTGVGSAFGFLTCLKIASLWLPPQKLGFFMSMTIMLGTVGAISGGTPLAMLVNLIGWQHLTLLLAALSSILGILSWLIVKDKNADIPEFSLVAVIFSIVDIFKNPQTWLYGVYGFMMYVALSGFADLWGVPYVMKAFDVDRTLAAGVVSSFYIGFGLGSPVWVWFANLFKDNTNALLLSALITLSLFMILIYMPYLPFFISYALLFLCGFSASGQSLAFVSVTSLHSPYKTATALGVQNMFFMFSGTVMQPFIGYLFDFTKNDGWGLNALSGLRFALCVVPISLFIALMLAIRIKYNLSFQRLKLEENLSTSG